VTPTSQIVGTQAVFNVLMGEYKMLTAEFADLMLGYYGASPAPRDPEVIKIAQAWAKKEPITCRPADLLKPEWEQLEAAAAELPGFDGTEEDVLTYAMFPGVASKFFTTRAQGPIPPYTVAKPAEPAPAAPASAEPGVSTYQVNIAGAQQTWTVKKV
jgi:methylmalonyl-CoA carboxyltransferase 5S subunit